MFKLNTLASAVAIALVLPSSAFAEFEISGEAKIEYGLFSADGTVTGGTAAHEKGDAMKTETSVKLFINSDVGEDSSFHAEVLLSNEAEAASKRLEGGEPDGQYEVIREFYFDTEAAGWDFRLGKQQVVWGTADGIKLLDMINPTDFRELNQNASEDSRIPIWMINAEKDLDSGANIQIIVSESKQNFIAGLDENGDAGAPFLFKGVDSITGSFNGFLHVTPALASVASSFSNAALGGAFAAATPVPASMGLAPFTGLTVDGFASNPMVDPQTNPGQFLFANSPGFNAATATQGANLLGGIAQGGLAPNDPNGNLFQTNLIGGSFVAPGQYSAVWNPAKPTTAFEFMPSATFSTFNSFAGAKSTYIQDYNSSEGNIGGRWKDTTDSGVNYSVNLFSHMSANPQVNMSWHDAVTGEELNVSRCFGSNTGLPDTNNCVSTADIPTSIISDANGNATNALTVLISSPTTGNFYGVIDPTTGAANANTNGVELRMVETSSRVTSIGSSFDMALENTSVPVIIRGEFIYDIGDKQPVVDKRALAIGDLTNALKMEDANYFKYVLGVDLTVMTNLLVSTQLIQFHNLDYIDESQTCSTQFGIKYDCSKYTGDFSSLSLTNGLNKGDKIETFVSFFLSKPFGDDGQHRWNNIVIAENGGGYWNRFDVEYGINDEMVGTFEINRYWGDKDTTFGQFETSSNVQLGLKYLF